MQQESLLLLGNLMSNLEITRRGRTQVTLRPWNAVSVCQLTVCAVLTTALFAGLIGGGTGVYYRDNYKQCRENLTKAESQENLLLLEDNRLRNVDLVLCRGDGAHGDAALAQLEPINTSLAIWTHPYFASAPLHLHDDLLVPLALSIEPFLLTFYLSLSAPKLIGSSAGPPVCSRTLDGVTPLHGYLNNMSTLTGYIAALYPEGIPVNLTDAWTNTSAAYTVPNGTAGEVSSRAACTDCPSLPSTYTQPEINAAVVAANTYVTDMIANLTELNRDQVRQMIAAHVAAINSILFKITLKTNIEYRHFNAIDSGASDGNFMLLNLPPQIVPFSRVTSDFPFTTAVHKFVGFGAEDRVLFAIALTSTTALAPLLTAQERPTEFPFAGGFWPYFDAKPLTGLIDVVYSPRTIPSFRVCANTTDDEVFVGIHNCNGTCSNSCYHRSQIVSTVTNNSTQVPLLNESELFPEPMYLQATVASVSNGWEYYGSALRPAVDIMYGTTDYDIRLFPL